MARNILLSAMLVVSLAACGAGRGAAGSPIGPACSGACDVPDAASPAAPFERNVSIPRGAYLGAYVRSNRAVPQERQMETLEAQAGRRFGIQLVYGGWSRITTAWIGSNAQMQGNRRFGRIANLSWTCGDDLNAIAAARAHAPAGSRALADYRTIVATADALRAYRAPVLLRFFHEFDLSGNLERKNPAPNGDYAGCFSAYNSNRTNAQNAHDEAAQFVAAWRTIWRIFQTEGTSNVSFEWCPSYPSGGIVANFRTLDQFYPGKRYVDWIGIDHYDKASVGFKALFTAWYDHFATFGKPLIVSETGEVPAGNPSHLRGWNPTWSQARYFTDIRRYLSDGTFVRIKAINYFDAAGRDIWYLDSDGTAGIVKTLQNPYFAASS